MNSQASNAATTKARRKEAREQAREKKNAELKKLEANGYNPAAQDDINCRDDLQNAQKKAARADAASR